MEELPFELPLMGIFLTDKEAAGRKENLSWKKWVCLELNVSLT